MKRTVRTGTAVNAALGVLFALVLALMAAQYAAQGRVWGFDAAIGTVVCLIALGRQRGRGRAAALGLVVAGAAAITARLAHLPGEPGPAAVLGLLVLGGSAMRTLPWRAAVGTALTGLALMITGLLTTAASTPFRVGGQAWVLALGAGLGLRFLDYRRCAAADAVRREERLALARELHDVVAHHVTGMVVQAQAARITARRRPETLDGTLAGIEEAGGEALAAMRRVVGLLRDTEDAVGTAVPAPGPEQLSELVRRLDGHGPEVRLRLPAGPLPTWPPEVAGTVHRIVQESLTNIARHAAHARSATVDVAQGPDGVTVTVTDDAPAGHSRHRQPGGFGLIGMAERVEALGGRLTAGPRPGGGWSVLASLPVTAREPR
ncbi:histidine kinase [Kitasatospora sp. RB6PN24]|uniref:sensor histidine kinase n=1 Tax=Kitasatospora humi TaxID=2893891 RepID=UPI001E48D090|nr:histidine kinase [Kitasatospora humi]MCC9312406.1 histidine kinase [Kitasatospora humi]